MANDSDYIEDEGVENDTNEELVITVNRNKIDARRKLEEYMELKRLRELTEF